MTARIYQRIKSSMQSGTKRVGQWMLEFEPGAPKHADPLMGWSGSGDVDEQVRMRFDSLEAAVAYCEHHRIPYTVIRSQSRSLKLQAYSDNFQVGAITPAGEEG